MVKKLKRSDQGGEPLKIHVVLPSTLAEGLARGKVMVYAEAEWKRGRAPLNSLPNDVVFKLEPEDRVLLDALEKISGGDTPGMLMTDPNGLSEILKSLAGHPRVTLGKARDLEVRSESPDLHLVADLTEDGQVTLRTEGPAPTTLPSLPWTLTDSVLRPLDLPKGLEEVLTRPVRIPRQQVPLFLSETWPGLVSRFDVKASFTPADFTVEPALPKFRLHLTGGLAMLQARLECFYGNQPARDLTPDIFWMPDPKDPFRYFTRNTAAEQQACSRLLRNGFAGPDKQGLYHLNGQNEVLNFFAREYPRLERDWDVTLEERLNRSTNEKIERIEPKFTVTPSGENWFDFQVSYGTSDGQRFSPAEIQRLLLSGLSHTRLNNGKFAVMDTGAVEELQQVLVDCSPQQTGGVYRLDNSQAGFLDASLRRHPAWPVAAPSAWKERTARQRGEVALEPPDLGSLADVLRAYQKRGVAWLAFLRANGFGGILADEMGLGKTVQVLAHLAAVRRQGTDQLRPTRDDEVRRVQTSLVVCPSSLVFNWFSESRKFTPELRVLALHGTSRKDRFPSIPEHDLVITSYALLRRDFDDYKLFDFDTVILDEAQHIKNRETQNAQSVKAVRSRHRLVLTGTPLENSVLDLWSVFDFLMPGYLGSATDFRERYEIPVVRGNSPDAQERLARRVRPFLLRRLKREVATDLPEKLEQVSYCDMTDEQEALYAQVLDASRREIVNAVDGGGVARSRMVVLTALLRLRQICCDPRLLKLEASPAGPEPGRTDGSASGKLELFGELLEEILDGGHRVLVFSQFTSMLRLLQELLDQRQVEYCRLDGSTRDRAAVVERFQRGQQIPVFLISLKAGGVGLNLTGADTVIHFDPWWNPAVEAQATDRAHRIGQKRVVTSYKLITRGTVEEKILHLQEKKRALLQGMLGDEEQFASSLSWEEIQELIS